MEEWTATETELMRERGLWGPPVGSELDKWMLDMTEGMLLSSAICNQSTGYCLSVFVTSLLV